MGFICARTLTGPGKKIAKILGTKRVYTGRFETTRLPKSFFDVVTLWHVLEHTENPKKVVRKIKKILEKEGRLYVEVPNADSFTWRTFGNDYDLLRLPEHLLYFNKRSLKELFESQGFEALKFHYPIKLVSSFSFSLANLTRRKFRIKKITSLVFYVSLPFSVFLSFFMTFVGGSELVRMVTLRGD